MTIGLLGKKVGMTQKFDSEGRQIGLTLVEAGPCSVVGLRTIEKDGYVAVQLGFRKAKEKRLRKSEVGLFKKAKVAPTKYVREIRTEEVEGLRVGTQVAVDNFEIGDFVDVEGISIGKGFQGVVKRHKFKAGEKAHGSKFGREAGSTGASAFPSRVVKGKKNAGHMGNERITTQNLKVIEVDKENNLLALKGAVPGTEAEDQYLIIRIARKRGTARKWKVVESETKPEKVRDKEAKEEQAANAPAETAKAEKGAPQEAKKQEDPAKDKVKAVPAKEAKPEDDSKEKS